MRRGWTRQPGPYEKITHYGGKIRRDGSVSSVCAKVPRAIDLTRAVWTIVPDAVTCSKCAAMLRVDPSLIYGHQRMEPNE